jgi:hypothetical protein
MGKLARGRHDFSMITQLANPQEQLDLAAEHPARGNPNNARFALMLSDNIVELALHRHAKDTDTSLQALHIIARLYLVVRKASEAMAGKIPNNKARHCRLRIRAI